MVNVVCFIIVWLLQRYRFYFSYEKDRKVFIYGINQKLKTKNNFI
jgi:hypothetical protein